MATFGNRAHIPTMADKRPKGQHNPSQKSLQRWDNEGGAIKGVHAKRPRHPNQLGKAIVDLATMDDHG